jgi:dTDP-4-dehydrorhamnose reductase
MTKRRLALIGSKGMLAQMLCESAPAGYVVGHYDLPDFNVTDSAQVLEEMQTFAPDLIVNCAAFTNVDGCEAQESLATRVNGDGPGYLAAAAEAVGALLVHISTDYVFSGDKKTPYLETDQTGPLSAYGRSKLAGEHAIAASGLERHYILRTSWLYGPGGANFVETILRLAAEREELRIVADQTGSPTYTGDLVQAIFNLVAPNRSCCAAPYGIYHFSNSGMCTWYEFACEIIRLAHVYALPVITKQIHPIATADYPLPAHRPQWSVFDKSKYQQATGIVEPEWASSLNTYFALRMQRSKEQ